MVRRRAGWRVVVVVGIIAGAGGCAATVPARPLPFPGGGSASAMDARLSGELRQRVTSNALALRGIPYRSGGGTPTQGFDCSGFVQFVFEESQIPVPRTVAQQYRAAHSVSSRHVEPGDLLFFSTDGPGPTHVGIVVSEDVFVHAPGSGRVVRSERFDTPYWKQHFVGARRIVP